MNGMEVYSAEIQLNFCEKRIFNNFSFRAIQPLNQKSLCTLTISFFKFSNDKLNGFWLDNKCLRTWRTKHSVFSRKLSNSTPDNLYSNFFLIHPSLSSLINNFRHETVHLFARVFNLCDDSLLFSLRRYSTAFLQLMHSFELPVSGSRVKREKLKSLIAATDATRSYNDKAHELCVINQLYVSILKL